MIVHDFRIPSVRRSGSCPQFRCAAATSQKLAILAAEELIRTREVLLSCQDNGTLVYRDNPIQLDAVKEFVQSRGITVHERDITIPGLRKNMRVVVLTTFKPF